MTRLDAHKLLDRILDIGFSGSVTFNMYQGGVTQAETGKQTFKDLNQMAVMAVDSGKL